MGDPASKRAKRPSIAPETLDARLAAILSDVRGEPDVPRERRVFCNRSLKMADVEYIGFDMDYTLALYKQESLEQLSIDLTLRKLVDNLDYPEEITALKYDPKYAIRGVVIDTKLGNVCKMDRHGHVGRVYHGFSRLSKQERYQQYRSRRINLSQQRYAWIDTLFGLPEAVMYITLVNFFQTRNETINYKKLYDDIRNSIDEAHADQSLKSVIKAEMSSYIERDEHLAETLHKFRAAGKKIFVLTNSYYLYTDAVMTYLLEGARPNYASWRDYFDWVIVGGKKPGFFTGKAPFFEVDQTSGEAIIEREARTLDGDKVYQGGNLRAFERMTGAQGDRVLYIGDHIYGDILKLKKSHVWRTAMVIQELQDEYDSGRRLADDVADMEMLDRRRRNLESDIDYQEMTLDRVRLLREQTTGDSNLMQQINLVEDECESIIARLRDRVELLVQEIVELEYKIDRGFNPYWGSIISEGKATSRFGKQVYDYADLYTSRVSNFVAYSPLRYFRVARNKMPHEV